MITKWSVSKFLVVFAVCGLYACTTVERAPEGGGADVSVNELVTGGVADGKSVNLRRVVLVKEWLAGSTGMTGGLLYGGLTNHVLVVKDESMSMSYAQVSLPPALFTSFLAKVSRKDEFFRMEGLVTRTLVSGERLLVPTDRFAVEIVE